MGTKILIVASYAPSLVKFRLELIESLIGKGYVVSVAAPDISEFPLVRERLINVGVSIYSLKLRRSAKSIAGDLSTFCAMLKLMINVRPDVVFAYTIKPVIYGMLTAALVRVPLRVALITGLGYAFTSSVDRRRIWLNRLASALYRMALSQASLVFFQNRDDLADFSSLGILPRNLRTVVVNGSGVNTSYFNTSAFPSLDTIHFLMIARLLGDKGVREYAQAASHLIKRYPNAKFHLVGGLDPSPDGLSMKEVTGWADAGGVIWHGEIDDVRPSIASSHIYVLPSYREGTPRTVLEAMAMGRPVITTDAPGCKETVVEGYNGFLVEPRSVSDLVSKMERFLEQPALIQVMGERSRQIVLDRYDVRSVNHVMLGELGLDEENI